MLRIEGTNAFWKLRIGFTVCPARAPVLFCDHAHFHPHITGHLDAQLKADLAGPNANLGSTCMTHRLPRTFA